MTVYLHDWSKGNYRSGRKGMMEDFKITKDALKGAKVLVASYTYEDYTGSAFVLFSRDGKLFEVHGSHCSCYGLEDQWEPEETSASAITHRLTKGSWGEEDRIKDHVLTALTRLSS